MGVCNPDVRHFLLSKHLSSFSWKVLLLPELMLFPWQQGFNCPLHSEFVRRDLSNGVRKLSAHSPAYDLKYKMVLSLFYVEVGEWLTVIRTGCMEEGVRLSHSPSFIFLNKSGNPFLRWAWRVF